MKPLMIRGDRLLLAIDCLIYHSKGVIGNYSAKPMRYRTILLTQEQKRSWGVRNLDQEKLLAAMKREFPGSSRYGEDLELMRMPGSDLMSIMGWPLVQFLRENANSIAATNVNAAALIDVAKSIPGNTPWSNKLVAKMLEKVLRAFARRKIKEIDLI